MPVIVLSDAAAAAPTRLDAQIRVGGDAGACEVIVLRVYGEPAEQSESSSRPCCCRMLGRGLVAPASRGACESPLVGSPTAGSPTRPEPTRKPP